MAKDHRRQSGEVAQGVLLDDPALSQGDRRVGATDIAGNRDGRARRRRPLRAHMASQGPQALHPEDAGGYAEPARPQDREGEQIHIQRLAPEPEYVPQ